jgi:hypothetical protein
MPAFLCPHCKVRATFKDEGPGARWKNADHTIWRCNNCEGVVYAQDTFRHDPEGRTIYTGVRIYPFIRSEAPEEYPEDVRENFAEAIRSLNSANPRACVVMTRSAMQAATRGLEAKGSNLKEEIDDLANRHAIPGSLREWAHEIRDGGNLVAHPEPGKRVEMADAEELVELAEAIFEYLYVVPEQIRRRRERLSGAQETRAEQGEHPPQ